MISTLLGGVAATKTEDTTTTTGKQTLNDVSRSFMAEPP